MISRIFFEEGNGCTKGDILPCMPAQSTNLARKESSCRVRQLCLQIRSFLGPTRPSPQVAFISDFGYTFSLYIFILLGTTAACSYEGLFDRGCP